MSKPTVVSFVGLAVVVAVAAHLTHRHRTRVTADA